MSDILTIFNYNHKNNCKLFQVNGTFKSCGFFKKSYTLNSHVLKSTASPARKTLSSLTLQCNTPLRLEA